MITIDDFAKIEIRSGEIMEAFYVEGSDKLLKLIVNFGEERPRQVISGIAKHTKPEDLKGVTCAFVTNLEPRDIMGLKSEAMIMATSTPESFSLLKTEKNTPNGARVK